LHLEISAIRSMESSLKIGKSASILRLMHIVMRIPIDLLKTIECRGKIFWFFARIYCEVILVNNWSAGRINCKTIEKYMKKNEWMSHVKLPRSKKIKNIGIIMLQ